MNKNTKRITIPLLNTTLRDLDIKVALTGKSRSEIIEYLLITYMDNIPNLDFGDEIKNKVSNNILSKK